VTPSARFHNQHVVSAAPQHGRFIITLWRYVLWQRSAGWRCGESVLDRQLIDCVWVVFVRPFFRFSMTLKVLLRRARPKDGAPAKEAGQAARAQTKGRGPLEEPRPEKLGMGWPENPGHPPAVLQTMRAMETRWRRRREVPCPSNQPNRESGERFQRRGPAAIRPASRRRAESHRFAALSVISTWKGSGLRPPPRGAKSAL
jgi:hypothetical protein